MQWNLYDVLAILAAYLIGNISPAIILGKLSGVDIKKEGSGNAGTTNVLRVLGKKAAFITLVIDIAKGFWRCAWACSLAMRPARSVLWRFFAGIFGLAFIASREERASRPRSARCWRSTGCWGLRHWPSLRPASSSVNACRLARYLARLLSRLSVII